MISYLNNRGQYVRVNQVNSNIKQIKAGVPLGSILGPTLFNFFINDIFELSISGKMQLYADDIAIVYRGKDMSEMTSKINDDLVTITKWIKENRMQPNVKKSNYIVFERKNLLPDNLNIKLNGQPLPRANEVVYLGLHIDSKLTWYNQIDNIKRKILPYMFALKKIRHLISKDIGWMIYYAHIHSHLTYLNPIWSSASAFKLKELTVLQNKVFKTIMVKPRLYPSIDLYTSTKLPVSLIIKYELLLLIFKIKLKQIKFNNHLICINDVHNYSTRNNQNFYIKKTKTNIGSSSVLSRGLKLYNSLDNSLKNLNNINLFKKQIKNTIFQTYLKENS